MHGASWRVHAGGDGGGQREVDALSRTKEGTAAHLRVSTISNTPMPWEPEILANSDMPAGERGKACK